ncbi:SGNH/GDSL hydrolase family protein [Actinoplanes sp. ATCC 53533]|uniref:SGNH/GDSL hydrolase family protein n=1 Tax=Actinoplanes sp. ATCC 53533 TaxID=1288362 RepID=UPI0013154DAB|nr:SGNH/GDSL hydrolase family protein [Actinoplanes sp. ATCC 53533]
MFPARFTTTGRRSRKRWLAGAATAATAVAAALVIPFYAGAATVGDTYVALGDSYSAGVGASPYLSNAATIPPVDTLTVIKPPSNVDYISDCKRSTKSYPALLATEFGKAEGFIESFTFAACSGATTTEVLQRQWAALGPETSLVSLTIGGNDIKFADAMAECANPLVLFPDCQGKINQSLQILRDDLPKKLQDTYTTILSQAPNARLKVLGYPKLFDEQGTCSIVEKVFNPSPEKRREMNDAAEELSQAIHAAVADVGGKIQFIDVQPQFDGHGICGPDPYLTEPKDNLTSTGDSYHPNAKGYDAYKHALQTALGA